jgi:hypothetical protein
MILVLNKALNEKIAKKAHFCQTANSIDFNIILK